MKKRFTLILISVLCISFPALAQTDADKYWILEDFSRFDNSVNWIDEVAEYSETYPNNVKITTFCANVESAEGCAAETNDNWFRIRGLARNGYLEFTVPNASTVKIYVSGKSDLQDRTVCVYRNNELIGKYEGLDRTICRSFVDLVNSQEPVTYRITGGDIDSDKPITVYFIEVLKYGMEDDKDKEIYWIKEDFLQFDNTGDWIEEQTLYESHPNNINITTTYANVEPTGDCASSNSVGNQMRIGGLIRNGSLKFSVPDAALVKIHVTGKSSIEDRNVCIYRNDELVKTYEYLDKNTCRTFIDYVFSQEPLTYKVTAGDKESDSPIAVYNIEVIKYGVGIEDPAKDYEDYWIYESFSDYPNETGYSTGYYGSFPKNIRIDAVFANSERGEGCTDNDKNIRISAREGEESSIEFTVPDYGGIEIGITGKSTNMDREALIYIDNELVQTITNLDRNTCEVFRITEPEKKETKIKITGGNNNGPVAVSYIHIPTYKSVVSIENPNLSPVSIFPNPVSDVIFFDYNNGNPVQKAWIMNLSGKQILSATNISQMDVSFLQKGIYLLKIQTNEGIYTHKLIKK